MEVLFGLPIDFQSSSLAVFQCNFISLVVRPTRIHFRIKKTRSFFCLVSHLPEFLIYYDFGPPDVQYVTHGFIYKVS
jgi:hypothetical protein